MIAKRLLLALLSVSALALAGAQDAELAKALDAAASGYYLLEVRAAFGTFTYEYSGLPTPFSRWVEDRALLAAAGSSRVRVLNRNAAAAMDPVLGATYADFIRETGAEALLSGRFFDEGGKARVRFELTELSSGILIGAGDWYVPAQAIPAYASVRPATGVLDRSRELSRLSGSSPGGLSVSVSTDRGAGAAYRVGEALTLLVGVSDDAYARVYHVDGTGRVQLIWPNRFGGGDGHIAAGSPVRLPPDESAPYAFVMEPPYGTEFIKVVASTAPFGDGLEDFCDLGSVSSGAMTRGLTVADAAPGVASGAARLAEALASYYIGP